jgi:hypothetical protein
MANLRFNRVFFKSGCRKLRAKSVDNLELSVDNLELSVDNLCITCIYPVNYLWINLKF